MDSRKTTAELIVEELIYAPVKVMVAWKFGIPFDVTTAYIFHVGVFNEFWMRWVVNRYGWRGA